MSCCLSPEPGDWTVVHAAGGWAVMSVCRTCGAQRRETPTYDDRERAERALGVLRARYNARATNDRRKE